VIVGAKTISHQEDFFNQFLKPFLDKSDSALKNIHFAISAPTQGFSLTQKARALFCHESEDTGWLFVQLILVVMQESEESR